MTNGSKDGFFGTQSGRILLGVIVVGGLGVIYALAPPVRDFVSHSIGVLARGDVNALRAYLLSFGLWAPVVSALLMVLQSIIAPLPAFVITFTNGLLFGTLAGAALSWSSAMAGAAICFYISRLFGRPVVERLVGASSLDAADRFFDRYGRRAILIARLLPFVPFDPISYGAGLTGMGFWSFFVATGIGQLPATLVYSYLGHAATGSVKVLFLVFSVVAALIVAGSIIRPRYDKRIERARERSARLSEQEVGG